MTNDMVSLKAASRKPARRVSKTTPPSWRADATVPATHTGRGLPVIVTRHASTDGWLWLSDARHEGVVFWHSSGPLVLRGLNNDMLCPITVIALGVVMGRYRHSSCTYDIYLLKDIRRLTVYRFVCLLVCSQLPMKTTIRIPRWTLSRKNWKHFCLTLTRISAFAALCEFGLYNCHYYYYYSYQHENLY